MRFLLLCGALALGCAACKKSPQQRFCDQDLSGLWVNASDRTFAYRLRDDRDTVLGEFVERSEDGGVTPPAEPIALELHRRQQTLTGVMRSTGQTQGGKTCPVEFAVKVTSCEPSRMQLVVETSAQLGEDCKRVRLEDGGEVPAELAEFILERAQADMR